MNLETLQIPAFITVFIAFATLFIIPVTALSGSKVPSVAAARSSDSSEGAACDLPPVLEIEDKAGGRQNAGPPSLDRLVPDKYKTATFAMG